MYLTQNKNKILGAPFLWRGLKAWVEIRRSLKRASSLGHNHSGSCWVVSSVEVSAVSSGVLWICAGLSSRPVLTSAWSWLQKGGGHAIHPESPYKAPPSSLDIITSVKNSAVVLVHSIYPGYMVSVYWYQHNVHLCHRLIPMLEEAWVWQVILLPSLGKKNIVPHSNLVGCDTGSRDAVCKTTHNEHFGTRSHSSKAHKARLCCGWPKTEEPVQTGRGPWVTGNLKETFTTSEKQNWWTWMFHGPHISLI